MAWRYWIPPKNSKIGKKEYDNSSYRYKGKSKSKFTIMVIEKLMNDKTPPRYYITNKYIDDIYLKGDCMKGDIFLNSRKQEVLYLILKYDFNYNGEKNIKNLLEFMSENDIKIDWLNSRYKELVDYILDGENSYNNYINLLKKEGKYE